MIDIGVDEYLVWLTLLLMETAERQNMLPGIATFRVMNAGSVKMPAGGNHPQSTQASMHFNMKTTAFTVVLLWRHIIVLNLTRFFFFFFFWNRNKCKQVWCLILLNGFLIHLVQAIRYNSNLAQ